MFLYKLEFPCSKDIFDNIKELYDWPVKLDQILIKVESSHKIDISKLEEDL